MDQCPLALTGVWVSDVEQSGGTEQAVPWRPSLSLRQGARPGASASFASTLAELTEQQNGVTAAKQVQEVFRKRGLALE